MNRGRTTKLSIRMSEKAIEKIDAARKNLNLSKAGIILFALSNIMKNPPSKEDVLNLESKIDLLPNNFPITVKIDFTRSIDDLADRYQMKKNKLVGLIVSDYFEKLDEIEEEETEKKQIIVQLNPELREKVESYSKEHYLPISGIISECLRNGPYKGIPRFESTGVESIFTNIPSYLYDEMKQRSDEMGIPCLLYTSPSPRD